MEWFLKRFDELLATEVYAILQLRNEVFILEQKCLYRDIDNKDQYSYHLFAKNEEDKICAYLRILDKGQSYSEISFGRVLVRKDNRGTGLAKQLLLKAISFTENTLLEYQIRIGAQAYLLEFYKGAGFVPCSEVYLEDNIPHIKMFYNNSEKSKSQAI